MFESYVFDENSSMKISTYFAEPSEKIELAIEMNMISFEIEIQRDDDRASFHIWLMIDQWDIISVWKSVGMKRHLS